MLIPSLKTGRACSSPSLGNRKPCNSTRFIRIEDPTRCGAVQPFSQSILQSLQHADFQVEARANHDEPELWVPHLGDLLCHLGAKMMTEAQMKELKVQELALFEAKLLEAKEHTIKHLSREMAQIQNMIREGRERVQQEAAAAVAARVAELEAETACEVLLESESDQQQEGGDKSTACTEFQGAPLPLEEPAPEPVEQSAAPARAPLPPSEVLNLQPLCTKPPRRKRVIQRALIYQDTVPFPGPAQPPQLPPPRETGPTYKKLTAGMVVLERLSEEQLRQRAMALGMDSRGPKRQLVTTILGEIQKHQQCGNRSCSRSSAQPQAAARKAASYAASARQLRAPFCQRRP